MPFSMRVVDTAAHFGACLAEELNPGASHATVPSCGRACIGSLTSESLGNSCPTVPSAASSRLAANLRRSPIQHGCLSACRQRARGARHTGTQIHDDRGNAASRGASAFPSTRHLLRCASQAIREGCGIGKGESAMNAKYSLLVSAFLVLFTAHAVDAQQPAKVPTLGYLSQSSGPAGPKSPVLDAFLRGTERTRLCRGQEHCHRVPLHRREERPSSRACGRTGESEGGHHRHRNRRGGGRGEEGDADHPDCDAEQRRCGRDRSWWQVSTFPAGTSPV